MDVFSFCVKRDAHCRGLLLRFLVFWWSEEAEICPEMAWPRLYQTGHTYGFSPYSCFRIKSALYPIFPYPFTGFPWQGQVKRVFTHQSPSLYLAPHNGWKASPRPLGCPILCPHSGPLSAILCVYFGHKKLFLHFGTTWNTWFRCDIIASREFALKMPFWLFWSGLHAYLY